MKIAICPGSFDPITRGHLDVITRACELFDRVIVLVGDHPEKRCLFSSEERKQMILSVTAKLPQVQVDVTSGLLAHYAKQVGAVAIVKGLRSGADFRVEFQQYLANQQLYPAAETVFLATSPEHLCISSSLVRQIASLGGDVSLFLPAEIVTQVVKRCCDNNVRVADTEGTGKGKQDEHH